MREKIIRYEAAGRSILSIKDAFYLTGSSSPPVIHLLCSLLPLFCGTLLPSLSLPLSLFLCSSVSLPVATRPTLHTPRRHVAAATAAAAAAACYLVLLKGYFSRPLCPSSFIPIDSPREQGTESWQGCLEITNHLTISSWDSGSSCCCCCCSWRSSRFAGIEEMEVSNRCLRVAWRLDSILGLLMV